MNGLSWILARCSRSLFSVRNEQPWGWFAKSEKQITGRILMDMDNTIEDQLKNWRSEIAFICKINGHFGYRRRGRTVIQQAEFEGRRNRLEEIVRQLAVLASRKSPMSLIGPRGLLIVASATQK